MTDETNYRGVVYPWQCDHVGHMNIMWYVSKFDEANWSFFARLGITPGYVRDSGCGVAGVQQNLSYRREMFPGDLVEITTRMVELRERSARFLHEMRDAVTGETTATCEMTAAHLDRRTRKATPWPSAFRAAALQRLDPSEAPAA
ncbi:MAG TPA: thioesterase family protein [Baekduia sp.]|jgi:acyl-CoA thioester hydrolase